MNKQEKNELLSLIAVTISKIFTQKAETSESIAKDCALRYLINQQKGEDQTARDRYQESKIWIEANDILKNQLHKILMEKK